jgi:hypothetical protein
MDSDSKLPSSEIKAQVLRDVDEGRISTNAVELIAACSALLQMSGGKEASEKKGVDDTSSPVHDQQVFSNNATLLKSNAFNQKDACTASAGAAPGDVNTVSPVAQPNFVNFHEPLHAEMEAGESSVRQPRSKTRRKRSSKETLWMKNYRELQVSYRYKSSIIFDPFQVIAHSQISLILCIHSTGIQGRTWPY